MMTTTDMLQQPIETFPRTSSITIKKLKTQGIHIFFDVLNYVPFRYENYSLISPISGIQEGEIITIQGKIIQVKQEFTKRRLTTQKISISDETGSAIIVWFNQPYLLRVLRVGMFLSVAGVVRRFFNTITIEPKEYEVIVSNDQPIIHTGRIVPIYGETKGLSSKTIREKIWYLLQEMRLKRIILQGILPQPFQKQYGLVDEYTAYQHIHFPKTKQHAKEAQYRLAFDELFVIQLAAQLVRKAWGKEQVGNPFSFNKQYRAALTQSMQTLPFRLTNAQHTVLKEILADLSKPKPMNRLLQGDVGSGKTVVAALACYLSCLNNYTSLVMAPTEILATQHYSTISKLLSPLGIQTALITRSKNQNIRDAHVVIGTHSLLNESLSFQNVGLVVVDEQHRFGVKQRTLLKEKGMNPHLLTMTATPIPRTVALTLYGELDLSIIDEMPKERIPVKTFFVPKHKRADGYAWVRKMIDREKIQAFIICPLIEESEVETMKSVKAVKHEYEHLKNQVFPTLAIGLLHGKLKSREKDEVMAKFKDGAYDILVSTSVVEVGIDIPNAAIMMIEGAERYGLAQLHQLRGRVGRGTKQSYCFLFTNSETPEVIYRLKLFAKTTSGAVLSEYDLARRGPGELYGIKQHGYANLKIASFNDYHLITTTKQAVEHFMKEYDLEALPQLKKRVEECRKHMVAKD